MNAPLFMQDHAGLRPLVTLRADEYKRQLDGVLLIGLALGWVAGLVTAFVWWAAR